MRTVLGITGIYTLLALGAVLANPNERVLDDVAWRADISTVAETIRGVNPPRSLIGSDPLFPGCREPFPAFSRVSK